MLVDLSALTEPVDRQAAIDFETSIGEKFGLESARRDRADAIVRGVFLGLAVAGSGFGLFALAVMNVLAFTQQTTNPSGFESALPYYLPVGVLVVIVTTVLWERRWKRNDPTTRRFRLDRFARDNGWQYTPAVPTLVRPGMMFETGTTRVTRDVISRAHPRTVEIGDHEYIPSPYRKEVARRGYIGIRLDAALPHIVLDSQANDLRGEGSSVRFRLDPEQRLSLEGDFDAYFTLYCPSGYERDALYLFAPDIMARFVDYAADFDVEIADAWLMLSTRKPVATLDVDRWRHLLDLVTALEQKLGQWGRWRDEQLDAAGPSSSSSSATRMLPPLRSAAGSSVAAARVAAPGRRLGSRRFRWAPLLGFIVAMAVFAGPLLLAQILFES